MSERKTEIVEVHPRDRGPQLAWGSVKRTYRIVNGRLSRDTDQEPLRHDLRILLDEGKWPPGSDYWPFKHRSDVVVNGFAFGRHERATKERMVSIRVGDGRKRIQVYGPRRLEWSDGTRRFSEPEAFEKVELSMRNAYGGVDPRVPAPWPRTFGEWLTTIADHPGAYPRNHAGLGYVVIDGPVAEGVPLPLLEDPDHLLTPELVVVGESRNWHRQPLPWSLDWLNPGNFPRVHYAGAAPMFPVPDGAPLEEVTRGFAPEKWRELRGDFNRVAPPPPVYYQEASLGMTFSDLAEGVPIECVGMHPEKDTLKLALPAFPKLEIEVEGDRLPVEARILHVVLTPHEEKVEITWAGIRDEMPRAFFPGIHSEIRITLWVDGTPVHYETPEPIYQQLKRAEAEGKLDVHPTVRRPGEPGYVEIMGALLPEDRPDRRRDQLSREDSPRLGDLDAAAGRLLLRETDWVLSGPAPFSFERSYSSSMAWRAGSLGLGWTHCLEQAVWEEGGWVLYRAADGREIGIPTRSGELGRRERAHHPTTGVTVIRVASDAYEVRLADGGRFGFVRVEGAVQGGPPKARLTRIWTLDGSVLEVRYDTHGRIDRLQLPSGQHARFEHDARGRLTRIFQPSRDGRDWVVAARFEVDTAGQLVEAVDALGRTTKYGYQARLLTSQTLAGGLARHFVYDAAGASARCVGEHWGDGYERELFWNPEKHVAGVSDAFGTSFSLHTTTAYQVDRVTDRFVNVTERTFDEHTGMVASQTTPDGETTYLYDAAFHLADVSAPDAGSVAFDHDDQGHPTSSTSADGHTEKHSWDHLGRLRAHIDPTGASTVYGYDGEGPLAEVLLPGEITLEVTRDAISGAITQIGDRHAQHDPLGRPVSVTDALGQVTHLRYAPDGRVAQVGYPGDLVRSYETDAEGRITSLDDGTTELELERDARGLVTGVRRGGVGLGLHRDPEGRVKMVESESFDFWELHRDAAGRVSEESGFAEDDDFFMTRDHRGLVQRSRQGRVYTEVKRDRAGRPLELEHSDETFQRYAWTPGGRLARAQKADRVTELQHDGLGRITLEQRDDAHWVKSHYGVLARETLQSSLGLSARYDRDALGRTTRIVATRGEQRLELTIDRDAAGRERGRTLPGGLGLAWSRDGLGRPMERRVVFGERTLATLRFGWTGFDRLSSVEDPKRGVRHLRYDPRGRLVQVGGSVRVLDEVGRVFRSEARDDHSYGPGGRLLETYGIEYRYDARGRRIEKETPDGTVFSYRWDATDRLVEVRLSENRRITYDYDGLGRMRARRVEARTEIEGLDEPVWEAETTTVFHWDGLELLHEVTDGRVTTWLWDGGALVGKLDDAGVYAALLDASGMPTELTDEKGNLVWRGSVDLYGMAQEEAAQTACPWRFPGHWEDPDTGLAHSWLRVWDPEVGGYLTPNPLGIAGGSNLYGTVDDPLGQTSPLGLGMGYAAVAGAMPSERLAAELITRFVEALDRRDGAAGPRERFDPEAAQPRLPDPEAILWGPWARFRPSENLPRPTARFTRLPAWCGLG